MNTAQKNLLIELTDELLADDEGISEDSYIALLALNRTIFGDERAAKIDSIVEATNGRFYHGE